MGRVKCLADEHPSLYSFHSINYPSEWGVECASQWNGSDTDVSIQLITPASGELWYFFQFGVVLLVSFHSINYPSEWGVWYRIIQLYRRFSFHSINYPSEWGDAITSTPLRSSSGIVSIQLITPASGEFN